MCFPQYLPMQEPLLCYSYRNPSKIMGKSNVSGRWAKNIKPVRVCPNHETQRGSLETIGKTSRYAGDCWGIGFPALGNKMACYSYRKPLETIGKSNVSAWWAKSDNALETIGESNVAVW